MRDKCLNDMSLQDSCQTEVSARAEPMPHVAADNVHDTQTSTASLKSVVQDHATVLNNEIRSIHEIPGQIFGRFCLARDSAGRSFLQGEGGGAGYGVPVRPFLPGYSNEQCPAK